MTGDRLEQLQLPPMVNQNTDTHQTAFTVSIDAAAHLGGGTGISAQDRARTIQVAIAPIPALKTCAVQGISFPSVPNLAAF